MIKKGKIKLGELKIQSFLTSLKEEDEAQLKGGLHWASCESCPDECGGDDVSIPCGTNFGCTIDIPCVTSAACTQGVNCTSVCS